MGNLQYSASKHGNVTLIRVGGSLDAETAPEFDKKIQAAIKGGASKIVCNMETLNYIASAGLGALISANEVVGKKGGEIRMSSMNDKITKIFKLLGFINLFKIFDSDEKAIDSF